MRSAVIIHAGTLFATAVTAVPSGQVPGHDVHGRADGSLDGFLDTVDIEPAALPSSARGLRGCRLACAILYVADSEALVTERSDPGRYDEEADAFW
jgi:hypothetical protein